MMRTTEARRTSQAARNLLLGVAGLFLLVTLPVVVAGQPLADDYHTCLRPTQVGLDGFLGESTRRMGAVRPARFVEIFVIAPLCQQVPFGLVILVPLVLTLLVGVLLRGLLRDLDLPPPWPEVGAALWLLHPLGTEAALWPSALHVPLGLALALVALRLYRRGRHGWAAVATVAACLSVEIVLAFPLAAWMACPPEQRRRATAVCIGTALLLVPAYALWPGTDPRSAVPLTDRIVAVFSDPGWYVRFPVAGLGLHSIALAVWWAFPVSLAVLALGGWVGARFGPRLLGDDPTDPPPPRQALLGWGAATAALIALVNVPLITTLPRGHTPRTFTPTWLILAALLPVVASRVRWRRARVAGAAGGLFAAAALLSLALSASVRLETGEFNQAATRYLARRVPNGGVVAVCDVPRTVVTPAPVGSFALHEFAYDWAAEDAMRYHAGRDAEVRLGGPLWGTRCPDPGGADLVVSFDELRRAAAEGTP
jgi:hypothetical protein